MTEPRPSQETFIVRLWKQSPQASIWRGQVQNVRTGQQVVIHTLLDLLSCFQDFFPEEDESKLPEEKTGLK